MNFIEKPIRILCLWGILLTGVPGYALEDFVPKGGWEIAGPGVWKKSAAAAEEILVFKKMENLWFDIEASKGESYGAKLEKTRQKMDQILGVTDWKIEKHQLTHTSVGNPLWIFSASYQFANKKHYLLEFQEFRKPHIYQVQIKSPSHLDLHDKNAQSLFSEIQGRFQ